jgi:hypothetical protein
VGAVGAVGAVGVIVLTVMAVIAVFVMGVARMAVAITVRPALVVVRLETRDHGCLDRAVRAAERRVDVCNIAPLDSVFSGAHLVSPAVSTERAEPSTHGRFAARTP